MNNETTFDNQSGIAKPYAGDKTPVEAFDILKEDSKALLIDVRTKHEWDNIGVVDLDDKQHKCISWRVEPDMAVNEKFEEQIDELNIDKNAKIFFLCRIGARSHDAAVFITKLGYKNCFNIVGGFEGESDSNGNRGNVNGWKYNNLPWRHK